MSKAFERELRGPSLLAAQGHRNQFSEDTIQGIGERNEAMAQEEYGQALEAERGARDREQAMQQSVLERQDEMAERQADFDATARQLSKQGQLDRGRFWASRSTGQKIAGAVELLLAGFRGAPSIVQKRIDDDVKAQEFAFYATRDTAQAKQTAFQMAMQKYQNADAARAMARVAALDTVQAQLAQVSAKWKGTEAANKADLAMAALQDEKMMQIAQGIQFVPSQYRGRMFIDPRTGLTYSESEAKALDRQMVERNFKRQEKAADVGGQLLVEGAKGDAAMQRELLQRQGNIDAETAKIAAGVQAAKIPDLRQLAEKALSTQAASPPSFKESVARAVQPTFLEARTMPKAAEAREQAWSAFENEAIHALSGAAVSPTEMERYRKQLGSAGTAEQRELAANAVLERLAAQERTIKAGASPAAQAAYDVRYKTAKGEPDTAPPSAKKGW